MGRGIYAVGDMVKLKADLFRRAETNEICKIVGILPSDHGEVQYRVRLVLASDIEAPETAPPRPASVPRPTPGSNEPWLKPMTIRTKK
jgi:hypothetical protein